MKLITFWYMTLPQKLMFFTTWFLSGFARALTLLCHYQRFSFLLGNHWRMTTVSTVLSTRQIQQAVNIKRSIRLASRYTPWHCNCLTQALVAAFWCKCFALPYILFIGFQKNSRKALGQEGHAWLTAGPIDISGGQCIESHHVISTYSNLRFTK